VRDKINSIFHQSSLADASGWDEIGSQLAWQEVKFRAGACCLIVPRELARGEIKLRKEAAKLAQAGKFLQPDCLTMTEGRTHTACCCVHYLNIEKNETSKLGSSPILNCFRLSNPL